MSRDGCRVGKTGVGVGMGAVPRGWIGGARREDPMDVWVPVGLN